MFREDILRMSGYVPGEQPQGRKLVKLNTNENPYPPSAKVVAAIKVAAEAGLQRYPDPAATAFRRRAAEVLAADCAAITPDWILCGNGSDDILTIVTRSFVAPGQAVRYATPSYSLYKTLAEIQGVGQDVAPYEADWSLGYRFAQANDEGRPVRLAYLANPNSPSGTRMAPGEVAALADTLTCPLLVDEAYVDFAETSCLDLVRTNERVLVSRTLSKSYALAGLRFGYVVAQPQVIEQLGKVKDSYNCDTLAIAGATAAIDDQAWLAANVAKVRAERKRLAQAVADRGFVVTPSDANFLWCTHPSNEHMALYQRLRDGGVLVRYMAYEGWPAGYDGLRITVGTPAQTDALLTTLDAVMKR
ncbi:histidinol-phosphate transaminase [Botrimarina hoheduenensis]|uniref:Histidinol-phosphate aminotransferase n=1 Tax=Botrimarina hoheduenensis TaxID=2528000 RepID=A0A5C5WCJ7_9BACT|nr:histidinol-phosphate transaminase [Botrimarina hoheduenensis]TWT48267.1 Histidinol-phosphate aminotransferase [Botrimarina hoheduenensis]